LIISVISRGFTVFDFDDPVADAVEKISVVADDYEGFIVICKKLSSHSTAFTSNGSSARRAVKCRRRKAAGAPARAGFLPARKMSGLRVPQLSDKTQTEQNRFGFGGVAEPVGVFKFGLQFGVTVEDFVAEVFSHFDLERRISASMSWIRSKAESAAVCTVHLR
jgi:hypothetical protein